MPRIIEAPLLMDDDPRADRDGVVHLDGVRRWSGGCSRPRCAGRWTTAGWCRGCRSRGRSRGRGRWCPASARPADCAGCRRACTRPSRRSRAARPPCCGRARSPIGRVVALARCSTPSSPAARPRSAPSACGRRGRSRSRRGPRGAPPTSRARRRPTATPAGPRPSAPAPAGPGRGRAPGRRGAHRRRWGRRAASMGCRFRRAVREKGVISMSPAGLIRRAGPDEAAWCSSAPMRSAMPSTAA